jgi:hypothetical protein
MATYESIAAVGKSIERLLSSCFLQPPVPVAGKTTKAVLIRTEDFDPAGTNRIQPPTLSVFLYRIELNKAMRAAWSAVGSHDGRSHLPLDLHFLLTPWAEDPEFELRILGRAMECLESTPILSGPLLAAGANWAPNEAVQVVLEDLPAEAMMRAFDLLPSDFRLSVSYIARVTRIDGRRAAPPEVATVVTGAVASLAP